MPLGRTVKLSGAVSPRHAGQVVRLQRLSAGTWRTVASARLSASSGYTFSIRPTTRTRSLYRVLKPADADHAAATSASVSLRTT
jgi:hypothetical protein